jgi:two-component system CheB/CheR fusion protein
VAGNVQLLGRAHERGQLSDERLARLVAAIRGGTARLAGLVDDLLDVSRIRTGQLELRTGPVDLLALVDAAVERLRARLDDAHAVVVEARPDACAVEGDGERLAQVVDNLLDNAVKYSPGGGTVRVALAAAGGAATLLVRDEGIGLPAGAAERIFEPFGRAANAAAAGIPGMGLGLHVCRVIVERHGGRIAVESPGEGRGTAVRVVLPCRSATGGERRAADAGARPTRAPTDPEDRGLARPRRPTRRTPSA